MTAEKPGKTEDAQSGAMTEDGPSEELKQVEPQIVEGGADETSQQELDAVDECESLRSELLEAKAKEAEYLNGWQRARAELDNARKRFNREQEQAYSNAKASIFTSLVPIVDDFELAFGSVPEELQELEWVSGVKLIHHKFQRLLEQGGVEPIEASGREFDPFLHQAVTHEPSEDVPAGHVIAALQKGYRLGDRVLRPSMVRVSSGAPPKPEHCEEIGASDGESAAVGES